MRQPQGELMALSMSEAAVATESTGRAAAILTRARRDESVRVRRSVGYMVAVLIVVRFSYSLELKELRVRMRIVDGEGGRGACTRGVWLFTHRSWDGEVNTGDEVKT
jgi:hypothetical protein